MSLNTVRLRVIDIRKLPHHSMVRDDEQFLFRFKNGKYGLANTIQLFQGIDANGQAVYHKGVSFKVGRRTDVKRFSGYGA